MRKHSLIVSIFTIMLSVCLLCFFSINAFALSSEPSFQDIDGWYRLAIEYNVSLGVFQGTSDLLFKPAAPMTTAMLVTVLGRLAEICGKPIEDAQYVGNWYAKYASWAQHEQIIPVQELPFSPDKNVTREAFAVYLCNFLDYLEIEPTAYKTGQADDELFYISEGWSSPPYAPPFYSWDLSSAEIPSGWTQLPIMSLQAHNIIRGYPDGSLHPHEIITRAEVCQVFMIVGQNYIFKTNSLQGRFINQKLENPDS